MSKLTWFVKFLSLPDLPQCISSDQMNNIIIKIRTLVVSIINLPCTVTTFFLKIFFNQTPFWEPRS